MTGNRFVALNIIGGNKVFVRTDRVCAVLANTHGSKECGRTVVYVDGTLFYVDESFDEVIDKLDADVQP